MTPDYPPAQKPLHVLILPMYYPEKDSSPHRGYMFYEQAMQLSQSGCQVGLVFTEQRPVKNLTWRRLYNESHFQLSTQDNSHFITMRMHAWNPKLTTRLGGIIWCLLSIVLVRKYIRKYGTPDLIHAHFGLWAGYCARLIRKWYHIPYIVTEHASSINGDQTSEPQKRILRKAYSHAQKVICVGTRLEQNLHKYVDNPEKITVMPNFVDTRTFQLSTRCTHKEQHFTFISIGNLNKRKGFHELLTAFHRAFKQMPHVSLVIAGDGEEMQPLAQQIALLGLQKQITLAGRLSREELADRLTACDAFVLASHAETFGIVFIEAMAAGLPAIGTVCGGPEDIITPENGFLVRPADVDALAHSMKTLYETYEQFDKKQIRQYIIRRFDLGLAGEQQVQMYRKALNHESNRS